MGWFGELITYTNQMHVPGQTIDIWMRVELVQCWKPHANATCSPLTSPGSCGHCQAKLLHPTKSQWDPTSSLDNPPEHFLLLLQTLNLSLIHRFFPKTPGLSYMNNIHIAVADLGTHAHSTENKNPSRYSLGGPPISY